MRLVPALALLLLAGGGAIAAPLPRYGIFYFSSQCRERQSDDAAGNLAILVRAGDGDMLFWSWSEGPMMAPVLVSGLAIDRKGHIAFTVDQGSLVGRRSAGAAQVTPQDMHAYKGTISASLLAIGGMRLPRVTNFATKPRECR